VPLEQWEILSLQLEKDAHLFFDRQLSLMSMPLGLGAEQGRHLLSGRSLSINHR
jgi:hypothetical protein